MKTINPDSWIPLKNKYNTKCDSCSESIPIGEHILWKKGSGVKHKKCTATLREEKMIITEKEWVDFQTYSMEKLHHITDCQCCGKALGSTKNKWINCDRRVCERCFMS